ncbi:ABC transporter substrate-binding protein [Paenibacillus sp. MER 99-2]|uniref:ABC transporter substrate-binding protein n=1 Tax=Paenibacillus sp. MER 99-2 TaxID=2939572 RepID=UPI0020411F52|nr:ABC transporter substrate-binding protein [Paenibacillus sp. MER 99-2]MCM3174606.1 ABC transporter substrate-binding protein [Paenibacillus sp. MER 99-2]
MKKRPLIYKFSSILIALALFAVGCGNANDSNSSGTSAASSSGGSAETASLKNLTIALTGDPIGFDPQNSTDSISNFINYQIYDRLVTFNDKLEIVPQLAESWETSEDGKTWTFQLRQGVTFQDGTPFNAEAVKTNFDRLIDPDKKLSQYATLGQFIESVTAKSESEVVFALKEPQGAFLNNIAVTSGSIISPKSIQEDEDGIAKTPVGTGPFKLKSWSSGNELVLESNQDYWGGKPNVSGITFKTVTENAARVIMLESGEADIIDKVPGTDIERLSNNSNFTINTRSTNRVGYIGINTKHAPFDNVKVRNALNLAIDRATLVNKLYEGRVEVATSFISKNSFGYADVGAYAYDVEAAKKLLQEAGVQAGTPLRIILAANTVQDRPAAEFVQNSLQQLGFKAELQVLELASYLDALKNPDSYDLFVRGASSLTGDGDALLRDSFLSTSKSNYAFYNNPKVDELIVTGGQALDREERQTIYNEALQLIKADAPWIPLYEDSVQVGYSSQVEGITFLPSLLWDLRGVKFK